MIAVIGSNNVDIVLRVQHFTLPGETQKSSELLLFPGGKGANQAVASKRLGAEVYFLSCIGNDANGQFISRKLKAEGLGEHLITVNMPNGVAIIEVTHSGENRIVIYPGANSQLNEELLNSKSDELLKADFLLLQNEIPFKTVLAAAKLFKNAGKFVIFDPAPATEINVEISKYVDIITPNEEEARAMVNNNASTNDLVDNLLKIGFRNVLLKLGSKGGVFKGKLGYFEFQAFKVAAMDSTAAGDAFNGALAAALNRNMDIEKAVRFASAAAAISVTRKGAQPSLPYLEEVTSFLSEV
ncbi:ribokinase [Kosmotoga arenicorallina S304]|uniref:Ribokinase n=1 Tax=Kosmotoga arenicorallina S304 TaxID=1453497 RepID=A0A176JUU5_9BACT|nr:ribokinase [Kosmotoga arenicorallina]OAA27216.1 ribokinase [Kosmotoga arenicorallina S304]